MGDSLTPINLGTGLSISKYTNGGQFQCALLNTSEIKCWGRNWDGQLGINNTVDRGDSADEMGANLQAISFD